MGYKVESSKIKLEKRYNTFLEDKIVEESKLDNNYKKLRKVLKTHYDNYVKLGLSKYDLDLKLAIDLYDFLNNEPDFTPSYEANTDFWKYVAVYVIPDIVYDRWSNGDDSKGLSLHFYAKNVRIYPMTLYWYIHLSYQGSSEKTFELLKDLSTDEIFQLVERPSKIGINVELYRIIMRRYVQYIEDNNVNNKNSVFRLIMKKHISKISVFRPEIYPGGLDGYVSMLFSDL